jgi:DUF1680 family protein
MRSFSSILCLSVTAFSVSSSVAADLAKLESISFNEVQIRDEFWAPRQEMNRTATIPVNFENLEKSGNIRNFELAGKRVTEGYTGPVFMDSDLYKAMESGAYSLATHPDPKLEKQLDEIIAKIAAAQMPDGYVNTYYTVKEPGKRWTNLRDNHELYCAGHMFEAAVAHYRATGKRNFLEVAARFADHIGSVFGPGKRMGYPGHPEIELALVKLSQATGETRYFELTRFFIENRGQKYFATEHQTPLDRYDGTYWQDDMPIFDHTRIKGHAVRAAYLLSGATDVAAKTQDPRLLKMINRVWRNTTEKNMYVTGGIGPSAHNEGFTVDYDLPNLTAYQETCASVALAQWNHRLSLLYGDAKYADVFERSLYNGALAGISLDGKKFFYVNPLESTGNHHRSEWFGCACCPPNIARTLASLGGYAYAQSDNGVWVNLYIQGAANAKVRGQKIRLEVTTEYPWDGKVTVKTKLEKSAKYALHLRVPGWCQQASVAVNKRALNSPNQERGYIVLDQTWKDGDMIQLTLAMPVQRVAANPNVKDDCGVLAIQRGPLIYCLEGCDQSESISSLYLPAQAELKAERRRDLFNGIMVVKGNAEQLDLSPERPSLYYHPKPAKSVAIMAVPYYAWDNRAPGEMRVWLPMAPSAPTGGGLECQAAVKMSFANNNCHPGAINDGIEPKASNQHPGDLSHWWPHKGTEEWVEYRWKQPLNLCGAKVYWFEDEGSGECRLPVSWQLEYLDNQGWKPVRTTSTYQVVKDQWCEAAFKPVKTAALRLNAKLQPNWAAGIHEWKVTEAEEE